MRKIIEETVKILKELAVDIHQSKVSAPDAETRIIRLALALEAENAKNVRLNEEKLDFLIFMQSKRTKSAGKEVILSGDVLFEQWRQATANAKQVDEKKAENKDAKKTIKPFKPIPDENQQ